MASEEHVAILRQGVKAWNEWRDANPGVHPDLRGLQLSGTDETLLVHDVDEPMLLFVNGTPSRVDANGLTGINLENADLTNAVIGHVNLAGANLRQAVLRFANVSYTLIDGNSDLRGVHMASSKLFRVSLSGANLRDAFLAGNAIYESDLRKCDLTGANLAYTSLCDVDLSGATLVGCCVHGTAAWNLNLARTIQMDLVITEDTQPRVTVDNLELAQFIHLLLDNKKLRDVIDNITSKVVLILGRFGDHKPVLDAIREHLRGHNLVPVMFDFHKPANRDTDETVNLLARMARFIIVDITDPRCAPQELKGFVESNPSVPVQPILQAQAAEYGMFEHFHNYPWVLPIYRYASTDDLLPCLQAKVIGPAEAKVLEIGDRRRRIEEALAGT